MKEFKNWTTESEEQNKSATYFCGEQERVGNGKINHRQKVNDKSNDHPQNPLSNRESIEQRKLTESSFQRRKNDLVIIIFFFREIWTNWKVENVFSARFEKKKMKNERSSVFASRRRKISLWIKFGFWWKRSRRFQRFSSAKKQSSTTNESEFSRIRISPIPSDVERNGIWPRRKTKIKIRRNNNFSIFSDLNIFFDRIRFEIENGATHFRFYLIEIRIIFVSIEINKRDRRELSVFYDFLSTVGRRVKPIVISESKISTKPWV